MESFTGRILGIQSLSPTTWPAASCAATAVVGHVPGPTRPEATGGRELSSAKAATCVILPDTAFPTGLEYGPP